MDFNERRITTRHRLEAETHDNTHKNKRAVRKKERKKKNPESPAQAAGVKIKILRSREQFDVRVFQWCIKREHTNERGSEPSLSSSSVSHCVELRHPPLDFHNDHTQDLSFIFAQTEVERCVRGTRQKLRSCDEAQRRNNRA